MKASKFIDVFRLCFISLLITACLNIKKDKDKQVPFNQVNSFNLNFPLIIDTLPKVDKKYRTQTLEFPNNGIIGFDTIGSNTMKINVPYSNYPTLRYSNDSLIRRNGLSIFIDTNQILSIDPEDRGFPPIPKNEKYPKERFFQAFPVFISNTTKDTISLVTQDGMIMMIQEALDTDGKWKPIQFWVYSTCGNSYININIFPNNFALVKIIKYDGDFRTKIRLKLKNGDEIYYSNMFNGRINRNQFKKYPPYFFNYPYNSNFGPFLNDKRR